jgi:hypothetical protein
MRPFVGIGVLVCASTIVFAGIIAGSGCTVLTNDSLPDDAGKFDGSTDASASTCATCLADACTGQMAACLTDPTCLALSKCAAKGELCACAGADPDADASSTDGHALVSTLTVCTTYNGNGPSPGGSGSGTCTQECSGAPLPKASTCGEPDSGVSDASADGAPSEGGTGDAGDAGDAGDDDASIADASIADADAPATLGDTVARCSNCIADECGDAKKACATGSECAAYLECSFAATDVAAAEECGRQHATGKTAAAELATCTRVGCSNACGF